MLGAISVNYAKESRACSQKIVFATRRVSEKYRVMCHGNGLLLITTNETPFKPCVDIFSFSTYPTRGSVAKTLYFLEHPLSGGDNGRDRLFKAQSGLRWLGEKPD